MIGITRGWSQTCQKACARPLVSLLGPPGSTQSPRTTGGAVRHGGHLV